MEPISLTTDRLVLREFEEGDWSAVHEYASDPNVTRYMPWGPNTEQNTRDFIQRAISYQLEQPRLHYELAAVLRQAKQFIGGCGIHVTNPENHVCTIGYCFNAQFWGRGYATEASRVLLAFGFQELKAHRIQALCDPANTASVRVLEKIGMKREGHLREHQLVRGAWCDSLLYAILEREWRTTLG